MVDKVVTFRASLPTKRDAIALDGWGDEIELRLVIPRSDALNILEIWQRWSQETLRVTVEADAEQEV